MDAGQRYRFGPRRDRFRKNWASLMITPPQTRATDEDLKLLGEEQLAIASLQCALTNLGAMAAQSYEGAHSVCTVIVSSRSYSSGR